MATAPGRRKRERGLLRDGVFAVAILTFIHSWNEFIFANTFLFDERTRR